ncbi:50S ribosomal protein L28 [Candidatus Curtissbacteria bacterium]|nr:50S ribosomal protein L28 [Candidatus Curtissbacteria bacterium]
MKACQVCGKKSQIQKSGAHNYGGGWAYRATKTRFVSEPNLHSIKVTYKGVRKTMRLCTKCLRRVKAEMANIKVSKVTKVPEVSKIEQPPVAVA